MTKLRKILIAIIAILGIGGGGTAAYLGSNYIPVSPVLDSAVATSTGNWLMVKNFKTTVCQVNTSGSTNATIKWVGTIGEDIASTTIARSATNSFEYLNIIDLQDDSSLPGDTGLVLSGTDDNRLFEFNTNLLSWLTADITNYTTGTIDVDCASGDDK